MEIHSKLKELIPCATALQAAVGPFCEVAIHDLRYPAESLVHLAGNVTNRQLGAPITDFVLYAIRKHGDACEDFINYNTTTRDGKTLRSSTSFIRNNNGKIIGCICINIDISPLLVWKHFLDTNLADSVNHPVEETFTNDISETLHDIIKTATENYPVPVTDLPKGKKIHIIKTLDARGVFLIKRAVELVASTLGVSRYTVYNYLDEIRGTKAAKKKGALKKKGRRPAAAPR
jgi:predicted transcriptional regulator YheO